MLPRDGGAVNSLKSEAGITSLQLFFLRDAMVEFDVPINRRQRLLYMPKVLCQSLGFRLKIVPNNKSAVIFPAGEPLGRVLDSLRIIQQDLELRVKTERVRSQPIPGPKSKSEAARRPC